MRDFRAKPTFEIVAREWQGRIDSMTKICKTKNSKDNFSINFIQNFNTCFVISRSYFEADSFK